MENASEVSEEITLSRKQIFTALKSNLNGTKNQAFEIIEKLVSEQFQCNYKLSESMKQTCKNWFYGLKTKWQESNRTEQRFLEKNSEWLKTILIFSGSENAPTSKSGRPDIEFASCSDRSKRRRTEGEISYATQMSLRASGKVDAAVIVKEVTLGSPTKSGKYRRSVSLIEEITLSSDSALSLLIEQKLSKRQYQGLRTVSKANNCKLYPTYKAVLGAKKDCYPDRSSILITECSAEVKLQALLDHTARRILHAQNDIIKNLSSATVTKMNLICQWGCDGTSGQSIYQQRFDSDDENTSDASIFAISLVPLQLTSLDPETQAKFLVWKNPRPSSPRYCRPLKLQFLQENSENTVSEIEKVKEHEENLVPFHTTIDGKEIVVTTTLAFIMVDDYGYGWL